MEENQSPDSPPAEVPAETPVEQPAVEEAPPPAVEPPAAPCQPKVFSLHEITKAHLDALCSTYSLAVIPEEEWPFVEEYQHVDELLTAIRQRLGQDCHIFPFMSSRMPIIQQGASWFLQTPVGLLPIAEPAPTARDSTGWVGSTPRDPLADVPPAPDPVAKPEPAAPVTNAVKDSPVFEVTEEEEDEE